MWGHPLAIITKKKIKAAESRQAGREEPLACRLAARSGESL